jgi:hypothetical protein
MENLNPSSKNDLLDDLSTLQIAGSLTVDTKVVTNPATSITSTSAVISAKFKSEISGVTEKGICYGILTGPTTLDKVYKGDKSKTSLSTTALNLISGTNYYVRGYYKTNKGTFYGNEISFKTLDNLYPSIITINHMVSNGVAPLDASITYKIYWSTTSGIKKGWITQNLGAIREATSANETSISSSGWYFQFNRKQGFQSDLTTRIPNTPWINLIDENSDWLITNDPCRLELGGKWRVPTSTELSQERATWTDAFLSPMKIASTAYLNGGALSQWGISGNYWSSNQQSTSVGYYLGGGGPDYYDRYDSKSLAMPCRCVTD